MSTALLSFYYKRNDTHLNVPTVDTEKLLEKDKGGVRETSVQIQKRVQKARDLQTKRFKTTRIKSNAEMSTRDVKKYCDLTPDCKTMMISAVSTMNLSARSYFKVLKVARTIADLAGDDEISVEHLSEALQYRPKESN